MIPIKIMTQPNDETCGPTSLQAVYQYYEDKLSLEQVIAETSYLEEGGTLEVLLGCHALARGYQAKIYSYNLRLFDPSWFDETNASQDLISNLSKQAQYKKGKKFLKATLAYIDFLNLGGKILFENLTAKLLYRYFDRQIPIIAGLSATYLYQTKREFTGPNNQTISNDIKGYPAGHFVVLCGYDAAKKNIVVADPYQENPVSGNNYYSVSIERLINSILLGIVTYDASLLIIYPKDFKL